MRDTSRSIRCVIAAALLLGTAQAGARTQCKDDVTAPCVELAGHVGQYQQLVWEICAAVF